MAKKRAFFSFDFDEDQNLKHHMVGQMRLDSSPFEAADWSMKEAAPERNWEQEAESRISRSDVVVVLVRNMSTTLRHSQAAFSEPRLWWGDS